MAQRHSGDRRIERGEAHGGHIMHGRMHDAQMRQRSALRAAGRTGGVHDRGDVLLLHRCGRSGAFRREHGVVRLRTFAGAKRHPRAHRRHIGRQRQPVGEVSLVHDHRRGAVVDHVSQARRLLPDADGHRDCAQMGDGEQRGHELGTVAHQHRHPVAGADTPLRQTRRQTRRLIAELAPGQPCIAADNRLAFRMGVHRIHQQGMQAVRTLRKATHDAVSVMRLQPQRRPAVIPLFHHGPFLPSDLFISRKVVGRRQIPPRAPQMHGPVDRLRQRCRPPRCPRLRVPQCLRK